MKKKKSANGDFKDVGPAEVNYKTGQEPYRHTRLTGGKTDWARHWKSCAIPLDIGTIAAIQQDIINNILAGNDALVLMPTGGGKSLCYQIPALVRPGTGIIISPLIALMQDQVSALLQLGVKAAYLNSTLPVQTARETEEGLLNNEMDLLYIAPERLLQERTLALLERTQVALFAIDEAPLRLTMGT